MATALSARSFVPPAMVSLCSTLGSRRLSSEIEISSRPYSKEKAALEPTQVQRREARPQTPFWTARDLGPTEHDRRRRKFPRRMGKGRPVRRPREPGIPQGGTAQGLWVNRQG